MKKKMISCLLAISILSSYIPIIPIATVSEAAATTVWEYNYTGGTQNFSAPYKGIYKIEVYGAQGGNYGSYAGGKGGKVTANFQFNKGEKLQINVGGQGNTFNGGGTGSISNGGGATDIRINGTTLNNRILVAGGGGGASSTNNGYVGGKTENLTTTIGIGESTSLGSGGGGGYYGGKSGAPIYHTHSGSSTSGGGCYTAPIYGTKTETYQTDCGNEITVQKDGNAPPSCSRCGGHNWSEIEGWNDGTHDYARLKCGNTYTATREVTDYSKIIGYSVNCGKTPGVTIDDYAAGYGGSNYITSSALAQYAKTSEAGQKAGNGYVKITLVQSYPEVALSGNTTKYTKQNVLITATAKDEVIGLTAAPYSWNSATRISANTYTATKNGTYNVNVINNYGNTETASINIGIIDKINPVVNSITQSVSSDKTKTVLTVNATDSANTEYAASGIVGYAITMNNVAPTNFQSSNTFTVNKNGTYYAWAKDAVGNVSSLSQTKTILVKDLEINVEGSITWNDLNNQYASRKASTVHLYRKVGTDGVETEVGSVAITAGQTSYSFKTRECDDNGNRYIFRIAQDYVEGYETLYTGNSVTSEQTQSVNIGVTNNLILPEYTSKIEYNLIDAFRGEYLKNTKLEMVATIQASRENRDKTGLNQSTATFLIDDGFSIDKNNIIVTYTDGTTGKEKEINDYTIQKNNLTINYGVGTNHVTKAGDKLTIKIQGVFNQIKAYNNSITLTGNLTDYKGTNTSINLGEVTKTEKNFEVKYQKPQAKIQIRKRDSITEEKLTDATFTLYEWNGSQYVEKEILRDENQDGIYESKYYEWTGTTEGKYRIAETGVPLNHKDLKFSMEYTIDQLKEENYTITPDYDNGAYRIAYEVRNPDDFDRENGVVENEPFKVKVSIDNRDIETKQQIQSNATYTIYEWDKTQNKYVEYVSKVNNQKVEMVRGEDKIYVSNGWIYYTPNNEGKYKVVETTSAYGYYGDYNENGNKREYEFNIVDVIKTGTYEGQTIINESTLQLRNNSETNTIENKRVDTLVGIELIDKETTTNQIQSSGTLEGAEYEIYAAEQINHADGITTKYPGELGILYKKDELVKTVTTNAEGKIEINDLECGKYYVKQKTAPVGYISDENIYEIDLTYQGQEKVLIEVRKTFENTIKKQSFQILKQQNIGYNEVAPLANAGFTIYEIKELSIVKEGKVTKSTDGTYTLNDKKAKQDNRITKKANSNGTYNIQDLVDYYYKLVYEEETMQTLPRGEKAYYPYNLSNEPLVKNYANNAEGEEIREIITRQDGYLKSPELAYGEYVVIETSVPHNFEAVSPIVIKITNDSRQSQHLRYIVDPDFETKIKIYTKDIETKENILKENAQFVIKNTKTGELMTYRGWNLLEGTIEYGTYEHPYQTTRKGYIITPMKLPVGSYELIQIQAPDGYVLNGYEGHSENGEIVKTPQGKINFEIATNQMYFVDNELESNVIVAVQENKAQVGTLKVEVKGEKLSGVDKHEDQEEQQAYTFQYEKQKLEGVELGLYAKENIYTRDEQKTLVYAKDQLVESKITNEEGILHFDNIPIGSYYVKEISTINGYALNRETKDISINYGTNQIEIEVQKTPVTTHEMEKEDQRQKVSITITNKDAQTEEAIQGTILGIYAKENIVNKDGNVVVTKDELVEQQTTNEEGKIQITGDLPLGTYYVKEIKTATGYVENKTEVEIDATYQLDGREVIVIEKEMKNEKTSIYVKPVDEIGNIIPNSNLQIIDEQGNIVEEWTSTEEIKQIQKLEVGKEYILKQKQPIEGYVTIDETRFKIQSNGDLEQQVSDEYNTIKPVHRTTKVQIHLTDKETKEEIEGIKLQIIRKEETTKEDYKDGEIMIQEFETAKDGYNIEKLPIGEYVLRQVQGQVEKLQNKGYSRLEDIFFEVKDEKEIQEIKVEQDYTKLEIELIDKDTKEKIPGVNFEIYQMKSKEDATKEIGEKMQEFTTPEENYIAQRLPVGTYILKQVTGQVELYNKGYVTNEDIEIKVEDKAEIQKLIVEQQESKLEIEVVDGENKEKVEGTVLQIINKQTNKMVTEFTTNKEESYKIEQLPLGEYALHYKEVDYTKGYIKQEDIQIQIIDTTTIQKALVEQDYTKVEISLQDKDTKEPIIGGSLRITNKEGKEITENWITDGKAKPILKLPVGEYYLEEKSSPILKGYVRTEKIEFKVEETKEIQQVEMLQDYTQVELQLIDEVTKETITQVEVVIKDEKGKEIATLNIKEDTQNQLEKLPVGTYVVESTKVPYGYKPINSKITIKDKQGLQTNIIEVAREEFDLKVEGWVQEIKRNDTVEYENKKQEQSIKKIDIKDKKINTEQIQITYKIKVSNPGKITGQVGKIEVNIPKGMSYLQSDNKSYWKEEDSKVITTGLSGRDLKSGAYAEIEIVLRWKNGLENFGTKELEVRIEETKSDNGFKETNEENNKAKIGEIIIGVSTGEMNLVYTCWILLAILILIEIIISRKTKIKKIGLKDKTLKYKK